MNPRSKILVKDIMTREVVSVMPHTPLLEAVQIMLLRGFSGLPVVEENKKVVGIVTEYDLITRGSAIHLPDLVALFGEYLPQQIENEFTFLVREVMNPEPLTIREDVALDEVVKAFSQHHRVNPIPIVNTHGVLTGIVARFDLIKFYASVIEKKGLKEKRGGFGLIGILIAIGIIVLLTGGGWYFKTVKDQKSLLETGIEAQEKAMELKETIGKQQEKIQEILGEQGRGDISTGSTSLTAEWKTYRNEQYGFEVRYPQSMTVKLYKFADQSSNQAQFSIGIFEPKFAGRIEGEIPQLIITNRTNSNSGRDARFFTDQDVYSDARQKLEEWIAKIHFEEGGNNVAASCILFKSFETESMKGLPLCNQILSTFKFIK